MYSSPSKKRKASATTIGPPEKKARRPTALETQLENLRETLAELPPIWEMYAGLFMEQMRHTREQIDGLTPNTIEEFIATGECDWLLNALDSLNYHLLENSTPMGSQPVERTLIYQDMRNAMIAYVELVRGGLEALVAQAQVKPTPTDFADSKIWGVYQEKANAIICLRPAHTKGLPIPIMHKVFCDFTRHLHEPTLDKHTVKYLTMADELCQKMPSAFESATARRVAFDAIFSSLDQDSTQHEYPLMTNVSISNVKESGAMFVAKAIPYKGDYLVLMLEGFENEDEDGDGDIYMQICRAYEVLCEDPKVEPFNPVFLLCILGPSIMVCGAVKRENVHVEPLTPFLPMFPGYGIDGRSVQLAHCLRALKQGLDALRKFWRDVEATSDADKELLIQRQHPNCPDNGLLCFDDWEGTFESLIDGKNPDKPPRFLAKLRKADIEVQAVVKFVYNDSGKYGKDTHEYLHGLGLAPRLYGAVDLHRGLVMVVMEHLAFQEGLGGWVELDTFEKRLDTTMADAVRIKLEKIIDFLQERRMVHADLRPKNIMVEVDEQRRMKMSENGPVLSLIDFDWAGIVNEVCYPPFLNPRIPWPPGAEAYGKVGGDDDRILLNNWWGAFVEPAGSSLSLND